MFDLAFYRSTGMVDRCAQTCTTSLARGPVDRPGRSAESSALCIQASVDRVVDRWHNGRNFDRWPVDRAVDRQQRPLLIWPPTVIFWEPINWGSLGLFSTRFEVSFQASFFTFLSVYLHLF